MQTSASNPPRPVPVIASILAIAATYGYFLLFAEFALLELAKPLFGEARALRPLLAVLCAGGIVGSLLAARCFAIRWLRAALAGGFVGCALSAALTLGVGRQGLWISVACVGLSLGWTTVTLSAGLRAVAGANRLGLWCGLGTGLAYAACNVPWVFEATPQVQTVVAIGLALVGGLAAGLMRPDAWSLAPPTPDYSRRGCFVWGVVFLALVWLDSAGFYVLQHTPEFLASTWSGPARLYGNALTHFLGALLAGRALDARRLGGTTLAALALLAAADMLLSNGAGGWFGAPVLYTLGVSAYSVALVYYPAFGARPWVAAGIFVVAGWMGSALGIGMVQDLHAIPAWFVALAGAVVFAALFVRRRQLPGPALAVVIGLAALGICPRTIQADETTIARGREVYIAEGCINCHSQYVRPGVPMEVEWWGPARPLAVSLANTPPLLGIRRQGPDLMNVGNRRSPGWQRLHLIAPRAVSPGSRMPGYAYLFQAGDGRGESLVTYLSGLGADTMQARAELIAAWVPKAKAILTPSGKVDSRQVFLRLCALCHGTEARGNGPLAAQLGMAPPDFSREPWRHLRADEPAPLSALARIIKFGLPGTPMAGHEWLDDDTVVGLANYVEEEHVAIAPTMPIRSAHSASAP